MENKQTKKSKDTSTRTKRSGSSVNKARVLKYIDPIEKIHTFTRIHTEVSPHIHRFLELAYVLEGTAVHGMNGVEAVIKKGDYIIIDLGDVHYYNAPNNGQFMIQNLLFLPEFVDRMLINAQSFSEVLNCYLVKCSNGKTPLAIANRIFHDDDGRVKDILSHLLNEYEQKKLGYLEAIRCDIIEIIIETIRKASPGNNSFAVSKSTEYICQYISNHFKESITLTDVCNATGYSVPYVSRRFKEENGMTFSRYLQQMRINEARRLLFESNAKIIDIAEHVGYSDIKFFNTLFKKLTGKTPREYRLLCRE
ncbi:MAG: helix-turn-helix domain-containing protein [Clostridia bacterium]|nr:helix-turn-helix domain-containing protein [Clostridia bacterium]